MSKIIAETKRLIIREFNPDDSVNLYKNHSEGGVVKWFPNEVYESVEEASEVIEFFTGFYESIKDPYVLAVTLKETNEYIGDTGFNEVDGHDGIYEIGYTIMEKYNNKGYATEVVECMKKYFCETFKINSIQGRIIKGNEASIKVLEKNDFHFKELAFNQEDDPYGNGMLVYEWINIKGE